MNREHEARLGAEGAVPTSILLENRGPQKTIVIEDEEEDFREYLDSDPDNDNSRDKN